MQSETISRNLPVVFSAPFDTGRTWNALWLHPSPNKSRGHLPAGRLAWPGKHMDSNRADLRCFYRWNKKKTVENWFNSQQIKFLMFFLFETLWLSDVPSVFTEGFQRVGSREKSVNAHTRQQTGNSTMKNIMFMLAILINIKCSYIYHWCPNLSKSVFVG